MPAAVSFLNLGDTLRMVTATAVKGLPLQQIVGELSQGLGALSAYLSVKIFLI